MFEKMFDLNQPLWRMMGFLSDMMLLTLVWVLFSIPIITIGPATIALFKVCDIQLKGRDQGILKNYYNSFFGCCKQMILPGILSISIIGLLMFSIFFYNSISSELTTFLLFISLFTLLFCVGLLIFVAPLTAILEGKISEIIKLAFVLSIQKIQWAFLLLMTTISTVFLTVYVAPYISLFSVGLLAILNTKVVTHLYEDSSLDIQALQ